MRRCALLLLLLTSGCSAKPLTGEHICRDLVVAVAARVAACAGDTDAAEDVPDAFEDLDCLVEDYEGEDAYGFVPGYYDCVGAMSEVDCDAALEHAEDAEFWLGQDLHCPQIYGDESDTGGAP
jgi:hypothetical protein